MRAVLLALLLPAIAGCRETHHCEGPYSYQNGECLPRGDGGPRIDTGLDGSSSDDAAIDDAGDDALGPCAACGDGSICFDGTLDAGHSVAHAPGCVQCVSDTDCDAVILPDPDGGGLHGGMPPLGTAICEDYVCVRGCRGDGDCGTNACVANRCTNYPRGTQTQCERCDVEENCTATTDCVPMNFMGSPIGSYCLAQVGTGCAEPYTFPLSDASVDYCAVNTAVTTCDAVREFGTGCTAGANGPCGRDEIPDDGVCANVTGLTGPRCTYACNPADSTTCPGRPCGSSTHVCGGA